MLRTQLYADPSGRFVHDVVLESCRKNGGKTALIDTSCNRRFTFAEYGSLVESLARGLISAGLIPDGHIDERSILDVQPGDLDGLDVVLVPRRHGKDELDATGDEARGRLHIGVEIAGILQCVDQEGAVARFL